MRLSALERLPALGKLAQAGIVEHRIVGRGRSVGEVLQSLVVRGSAFGRTEVTAVRVYAATRGLALTDGRGKSSKVVATAGLAASRSANRGDGMLADWRLGANVWDANPSGLREFYREGIEGCVRDGVPWSHHYECSSPDMLRECRMVAYPLAGGAVLVVDSLQHEAPHPPGPPGPLHSEEHEDEHGNVMQCMHCRCVRRADGTAWDWIPQLVAELRQNMTGGLCAPCYAHHYQGAPPLDS